MRIRAVAVAALVFGCAGQSATTDESMSDSSRAVGCDLIEWSAPDSLKTDDGYLVYVENPIAVQAPDAALLVGHWMREATPRGVLAPLPPGQDVHGSGILVDTGGRIQRIAMPTGQAGLNWPALARSSNGVVTAIWSPNDSFPYNSSRLVAAEFADGAWSTPQTISDGFDHQWGPLSSSPLVSVGDELRMVVSLGAQERHAGLLLRRTTSGWRSVPIDLPPYHLFPRLAPVSNDTLVLAYVGGGPEGNTLYVQPATISGDLVGEPERMSIVGAGPAHDPHLLGTDSLLFLVWRVDVGPDEGDQIHLASSRDGGRHWTHHAVLTGGGSLAGLTASIDSRQRLHVAARRSRGEESTPVYAIWDGSAWHAPAIAAPRGSLGIGTPVLLTHFDDGPRIIWASMNERSQRPPTLLFARGRYCSSR